MKQKIILSVLVFIVVIFESCNTSINGEVIKKNYAITFSTEGQATITATIDGNEIDSGTSIKENSIIEFKAIFDEQKYEVQEWIGAKENTFDKTRAKLVVSENVDVKVILMDKKPIEVSINFTSGPNGKIRAMVGNRKLNSGDKVIKESTVNFEAIADDGYEVSLWSGVIYNDEEKNHASAIAKTDLNVSVIFKPMQ